MINRVHQIIDRADAANAEPGDEKALIARYGRTEQNWTVGVSIFYTFSPTPPGSGWCAPVHVGRSSVRCIEECIPRRALARSRSAPIHPLRSPAPDLVVYRFGPGVASVSGVKRLDFLSFPAGLKSYRLSGFFTISSSPTGLKPYKLSGFLQYHPVFLFN